MHENNPFQNIKNYWGSHYSTITEGAVKGLLNDMGYFFTDEGEHAGKWVHEKTGKALSDDHAMEIAAERANRKKKSKTKETDAAGPNPTDKDARKQGEESTHSEEVEYDGEELEERRSTRGSPFNNTVKSRTNLLRGYEVRGMPNGLPGPDDSPYGRARKRKANIKGKMGIIKAKNRATDNMYRREFPSPRGAGSLADELFHKDSDRLLREHIRAEYEACGIYPTSREVQETYNHVVSILNERNQANKEASRRAEIKSGRKVLGRNWGFEEDAINAARNTKAGLVNSPMPKGGTHSSSPDDATGIRRSKHIAKRGVQTKISPSSPARSQDKVEKDTRFLMGQGFSPSHLRRIMSDSGR
jgi:hypothetical protein